MTTICPLCGASVDEVSRHYGSDDCPAIVAAFGTVTAEGKRRERDTHYRLTEAEKEARREEARERTRAKSHRLGFVARATVCRMCGGPVWRNGRCEVHEREHNSAASMAYYAANRERINHQARERRAAR